MKNQVTDQELKEALTNLGIEHDLNSLMAHLPQSFTYRYSNYKFHIETTDDFKYEANYANDIYILFCSYEYDNLADAIAYCVKEITYLMKNNEITNVIY